MPYAEVAVDARMAPGRTFSYSVPAGVAVQVGHAVQVPFGPRQIPGFVFQVTQLPNYPDTREISSVIDSQPWLSEVQVALARWISDRYYASLYSAASLMIPAGYRQRVVAVYEPASSPPETALRAMDERQQHLYRYLQGQGSADQHELEHHFGKRPAEIAIGQLVRKKVAQRRWEWLKPRVRPKLVDHVSLAVPLERALAEAQGLSRITKEETLLRAVLAAGDSGVTVEHLKQEHGAVGPALKALAERGLVQVLPRRVMAPDEAREEAARLFRRRSPQAGLLDMIAEAGPEGLSMVVLRERLGGAVTRLKALETLGVLRVLPETVRTADPQQGQAELARTAEARLGKRGALLRALAGAGAAGLPAPELAERFGPIGSLVKELVARGLVAVRRERVERDPLAGRQYAPSPPPSLTPHQERAWREIEAALVERTGQGGRGEPRVFLLHGVTGSGKTELYLRALEKTVAMGKRGIVLVPEISLTPQTIERFASRFPGRVAVLHSRLSPGEHFDEWWRIREGRFDVVVGSRGAVFAPQPDLGLIVLDEEHEWTYKQHEQQPLYHAREVAVKLAELTGATVVLGSATPQVESYRRAKAGEYRLLELPERVPLANGGAPVPMPRVEIVDMREELKLGNRSVFSAALRNGILAALRKKEQAILFLNRRGAATFVQCRDCGHVAKCGRCSAILTYHAEVRPAAMLRCHLCNEVSEPPSRCPECWGANIRYMGMGTERLELEVAKAFPSARTLRWDRDVTTTGESHETILRQFLDRQADILIGTQMIAKGLHLPGVTLVGVVNADIGLHAPDFRAPERVFQVLCQVAGRAGRGAERGRVIFQTYSPGHYAVAAAAVQDYPAFYEQEVRLRAQVGLPPFSRLARLLYLHTNAAAARREAERMHAVLRQRLESEGFPGTKLIGPAPAPIERVRGHYRWHIVVQGPEPALLLAKTPIPDGWSVDVDPVTLM